MPKETFIKLAFQSTKALPSWSGYGGLTFEDKDVHAVREERAENLLDRYPDNFYKVGTRKPKIEDTRPTVADLEDKDIRSQVARINELAEKKELSDAQDKTLVDLLERRVELSPIMLEDLKAELSTVISELEKLKDEKKD